MADQSQGNGRDLRSRRATSMLGGPNAAYLEALYERYLQDPGSVDPQWRRYFDSLPQVNAVAVADTPHSQVRSQFRRLARERRRAAAGPAAVSLAHERKQVRVLQLINAYRFRGHQVADLDPLGLWQPPDIEELRLAHYDLSDADCDQVFDAGSLAGVDKATLREILDVVQRTYCGPAGWEYMHMTSTAEKRWVQERVEHSRGSPRYEPELKHRILDRLTAGEGLERYLHAKYVGQKRFSLEGAESLIPLLDELIRRAGSQGVQELVLGMAHRGRLNVLVNVLGKSARELFREFEGKHKKGEGTGDVKYHLGFSSDLETPGGLLHLALAFNPSHLEIVNPVVEGSVRARQDRRGDRTGEAVIPVLIHGDASFAGQGVVMENFNMSQTRGFSTKGTVHIVVNNQIGFTTSTRRDARSTLYCTDVAKMVNAPIFHVNGDHPEAVVFATQLALDYRMTFGKDAVVDLICYRRHGHNEADEPAVTQPRMYQRVRNLATPREQYASRLESEGVIGSGEAEQMAQDFRERMEHEPEVIATRAATGSGHTPYAVDWSPYRGGRWDDPADTTVPGERLKGLAQQALAVPEGFQLHKRVAKLLGDRRKMASGALPIDWGFAETMAYATLVDDGYGVRLSGQDSARGTFFHRHTVLHDQGDGRTYVPLRHVGDRGSDFLVIDSLLSEEAVLGFEYGYATAAPESLVIWEAQYGDFANGAQVVIDQFISSGEQKWDRLCHLVLFLPHGYEGQGPEHSSARPERFLQLCAQHNMQVCVPTTPAQTFHMLRRQMIRRYRKPLVVMTPKSLLRHRLAVSSLDDLTRGRFHPVIGEVDELPAERVSRVIMCSGKVYYDLLQKRRELERKDVAIVRIEQLYPFPEADLAEALMRYRHADTFLWCQEEPLNQGAWYHIRHRLQRVVPPDAALQHVTRPASASPAVGYADVHVRQQRELVEAAIASDGEVG